MVELREQLGALLCLELKYSTRDYLLDLTSQSDSYDDDTKTLSCNVTDGCTTLQGRASPSCEVTLESATEPNNAVEGGKSLNGASLPSRTVSLSAKSAVITEHEAVAWREKICEWSYQGKCKSMQYMCVFIGHTYARLMKGLSVALR